MHYVARYLTSITISIDDVMMEASGGGSDPAYD
ncbi:MAG: hypothetical protein JWP37_1595 [Mucilaginibacter sp.]|nr:hypothetical protein [Mucilaginibacter sp.]